MSSHSTRKTFFLQLGGLVAAVGVFPKVLASLRSAAPLAVPVSPPVALRREPRAVVRREGSF